MSLDDYDLRDPQRFMVALADREPLMAGDVLLVLVHQPASAQRILDVRHISLPSAPDEHRHELSDLLHDEVWAMPIPSRAPGSHSVIVTVVCRHGLNGWGPTEKELVMGWRYSNHNSDAFDFGFIVVTEHGWSSMLAQVGGHEPRILAATATATTTDGRS